MSEDCFDCNDNVDAVVADDLHDPLVLDTVDALDVNDDAVVIDVVCLGAGVAIW